MSAFTEIKSVSPNVSSIFSKGVNKMNLYRSPWGIQTFAAANIIRYRRRKKTLSMDVLSWPWEQHVRQNNINSKVSLSTASYGLHQWMELIHVTLEGGVLYFSEISFGEMSLTGALSRSASSDPQRAEKTTLPVLCESEFKYPLKISEISICFSCGKVSFNWIEDWLFKFPLISLGAGARLAESQTGFVSQGWMCARPPLNTSCVFHIFSFSRWQKQNQLPALLLTASHT